MKTSIIILFMVICFNPITISKEIKYDNFNEQIKIFERRLDKLSIEIYKDTIEILQIAIWVNEQQHFSYPGE